MHTPDPFLSCYRGYFYNLEGSYIILIYGLKKKTLSAKMTATILLCVSYLFRLMNYKSFCLLVSLVMLITTF